MKMKKKEERKPGKETNLNPARWEQIQAGGDAGAGWYCKQLAGLPACSTLPKLLDKERKKREEAKSGGEIGTKHVRKALLGLSSVSAGISPRRSSHSTQLGKSESLLNVQ